MIEEEQVEKNLELARRFAHHLLDHPDELLAMPDGADVVLIPADDPEVAEANLQLAKKILAERLVNSGEGQSVLLRTVPS